MMKNLDEVNNSVIRGVRGMPLVGIVEFFLYRACQYFRDRYTATSKVVTDICLIYGTKLTEYMADAIKKERLYRVNPMGIDEHRIEVLCREKG